MQELLSLIKYFWLKILITIPTSFLIIGDDGYLVIWGLIFIVILDTILGIWVSVIYKVFASYKLGRISSKISKYSIAMLTVWVLKASSPVMFGWTFHFMGVFLISTEVLSNFEKLSLLGVKLPTRFLAKINKDFSDYYFGDTNKKGKALKRILNKEQGGC